MPKHCPPPVPPRIYKQWERKREPYLHSPNAISNTKEAFGPECDINRIMAKFEKTGLLEHVRENQGNYGDFTNLPTDYHAAQNQILAAGTMFLTLPSKIRAKFDNDPGKFLAFVENPANGDEMRELGLLPHALTPDPLPSKDPPPAGPQGPTTNPPGSPTPA